MKKLIIVRGIPGSGKSTHAKELQKELNAAHWEADMFFMKDGKYNWNPKLAHIAHMWCFKKVFKSFEDYDTVIVSNTFLNPSDMKQYITEAQKLGIEVEVHRMTNEFQNVHGVPEERLQEMKNKLRDYPGEILYHA